MTASIRPRCFCYDGARCAMERNDCGKNSGTQVKAVSPGSPGGGLGCMPGAGLGLLHLLAALGHQRAVVAAGQAGAHPDVRDAWGRTPLHWAAARGHEVRRCSAYDPHPVYSPPPLQSCCRPLPKCAFDARVSRHASAQGGAGARTREPVFMPEGELPTGAWLRWSAAPNACCLVCRPRWLR